MGKVGDLSKLHEKYFDQGFRVIGVSSENAGKLEKMLQQREFEDRLVEMRQDL